MLPRCLLSNQGEPGWLSSAFSLDRDSLCHVDCEYFFISFFLGRGGATCPIRPQQEPCRRFHPLPFTSCSNVCKCCHFAFRSPPDTKTQQLRAPTSNYPCERAPLGGGAEGKKIPRCATAMLTEQKTSLP